MKIRRFQDTSTLVIPKSFAGRSGKEELEGTSLEFFDRFEFRRDNVKTRLQGTVNRFNFNAKVDSLRGLVWESRKSFPKRNMCMDCHSTTTGRARTQVWLGEETRNITPLPFVQDTTIVNFPDADVTKGYCEVRHWVTPHQRIHAGLSRGKMANFRTYQKASSTWVGWSWYDRHKLELSSELRSSRTDKFDTRREFTGVIQWKKSERFSLGLKGGILLDGFGYYDLGFSDLGTVVVPAELGNQANLPSIYQKMKNSRFGYYSIQARYEYAF